MAVEESTKTLLPPLPNHARFYKYLLLYEAQFDVRSDVIVIQHTQSAEGKCRLEHTPMVISSFTLKEFMCN